LPKNTSMISVFRIEVDERRRTKLTDEQAQKICTNICRFANLPRVGAVQVDFDALLDEREFYRNLLGRLRASLPANCPISITALTSWCMCDNWMQKLPVDESVPMFFSMGHETHNVISDVSMGRRFGDKRCDKSLGISLDEPKVNAVTLPDAQKRVSDHPIRLYIFSAKKWSGESIQRALQLARGKTGKITQ